MQCFATMHSFFISTVNPPLFTRTDLEECPDDGESGVDEDPGLGDEQQQVVQLERGLGVVVQPPHLAQYSTVQYSTVQYSAVQHSTVQYSAVQHSPAPGTWPPAPPRSSRCTGSARRRQPPDQAESQPITARPWSRGQLPANHSSPGQPARAAWRPRG